MPSVPDTPEEYIAVTMRTAEPTIHDVQSVKTGKVLTLEQFRFDRAREKAMMHFLTGLTEMFTHIFAEMTDRGLILRDDPAIPVFTCTAPSFAYLQIARKM